MGLVPQGRRVFRSLTVKENLNVAAQPARKGTGAPEWTMDRVFKVFPRLHERQAQLAGSLSGGEQQMLAIGAQNCYFVTLEQCRAAVSGVGGFCKENLVYDGRPVRTPEDGVRPAKRKRVG